MFFLFRKKKKVYSKVKRKIVTVVWNFILVPSFFLIQIEHCKFAILQNWITSSVEKLTQWRCFCFITLHVASSVEGTTPVRSSNQDLHFSATFLLSFSFHSLINFGLSELWSQCMYNKCRIWCKTTHFFSIENDFLLLFRLCQSISDMLD